MIDRACISLGNQCNLRCKYCHFQDKQKDFHSFTSQELREIVEQIHQYCILHQLSVFKLGIVGSGEPLLNFKELKDIVEYIEKNSYTEFALYTITNGTVFSDSVLHWFYDHKQSIKLCFSLDGYEAIHNAGRSHYDLVMKAIHFYKSIFGVMPAINATVNRLSFEHKEELIQFFINHDLLDVTFSKLVGYFDDDLYISDEEFKVFMDYVKQSGIYSRQFRNEKVYDCTMYGKYCGVGRTNIFITLEGVYPCGRFYKHESYRLGDYNTSLECIEKELGKLKPVDDGLCYYIENVEGK